jgi:hypothetical protein
VSASRRGGRAPSGGGGGVDIITPPATPVDVIVGKVVGLDIASFGGPQGPSGEGGAYGLDTQGWIRVLAASNDIIDGGNF